MSKQTLESLWDDDNIVDNNIVDNQIIPNIDDFQNIEPEPDEPDDTGGDTDDEPNDDSLIVSYLKGRGIEDPSKLRFQNDDGEIVDVDFENLSRTEQLNILNDLGTPLSDSELEAIEYLRSNNATLDEVINYFAEEKLQEYLSQNPDSVYQQRYTVDDFSDDELFVADIKSKYPSLTDDELTLELNKSKENEDLFTKKVNILRESYKEAEQQEIEHRNQLVIQEQEDLKNNISSAINSLRDVPLDVEDVTAGSIEIDDSEKQEIMTYLFNQDSDGKSQFVKDIENPESLVELALFKTNGSKIISGISQYWKEVLKEERNTIASLKAKLSEYEKKSNTYVANTKPKPDGATYSMGDLYQDHFKKIK